MVLEGEFIGLWLSYSCHPFMDLLIESNFDYTHFFNLINTESQRQQIRSGLAQPGLPCQILIKESITSI